MKNRFAVLIMLVAATNFLPVHRVSAQTTEAKLKSMTPPQRAGFQTSYMESKMTLNTRQISQVKAINLKYAYKFQPILTADNGRTTKEMKLRSMQQQKDMELKGVFTPAQFTQYKNFEDDLAKRMEAKM